jgi:membrane dipeptidase
MSARILDAHTDLLLELVHRRHEDDPFGEHWLPNLERGGVALQVCPVYAADLELLPERALRASLEQVQAYARALRDNADRVIAVRSRADLEPVVSGARMGMLLSMEGVEPLGYDPELVDVFWELGVRMASLTWNRRNAFADGAGERGEGGLSRLGERLVDRMVELGIVIDLAHASERTYWDVLERTEGAQVVVSHAGCQSVHGWQRNLSDKQLEGLAARGGVLGIMLVPIGIDAERWEIERVVDHIDHAVRVMGPEHVGLGGDFMQQLARALDLGTLPGAMLPAGMPIDAAIDGLAGPEDYPNLVRALEARGYAERDLEGVLMGNFLRVLEAALL